MSEIKLEDGMPIPMGKGVSRYPFEDMEVGQSFFVEGGKSAAVAASTWQRANRPKRLITRTVTESGVKGVRVWRKA